MSVAGDTSSRGCWKGFQPLNLLFSDMLPAYVSEFLLVVARGGSKGNCSATDPNRACPARGDDSAEWPSRLPCPNEWGRMRRLSGGRCDAKSGRRGDFLGGSKFLFWYGLRGGRSEERRVGKEGRSRWAPDS